MRLKYIFRVPKEERTVQELTDRTVDNTMIAR